MNMGFLEVARQLGYLREKKEEKYIAQVYKKKPAVGYYCCPCSSQGS
jgi:hypothetical protein